MGNESMPGGWSGVFFGLPAGVVCAAATLGRLSTPSCVLGRSVSLGGVDTITVQT
jgi:hypothetical protein